MIAINIQSSRGIYIYGSFSQVQVQVQVPVCKREPVANIREQVQPHRRNIPLSLLLRRGIDDLRR